MAFVMEFYRIYRKEQIPTDVLEKLICVINTYMIPR